jgi:RNA polymerase sigma-70 factor (ECF subfamily)
MSEPALKYAAMSEGRLIDQARNGDHQAFGAIMQRCNQRLFRVARAVMGNDEEAEDVLQEAYLKAFSALAGFRGEARLLTWLTSITLNEARGRLRRNIPVMDPNIMDNARVIPFPSSSDTLDPEAEAERSEARRLLEKAIDRLPAEFRVVYMMRDVEGCSIEETAEQLSLNPATVRTRLFRARKMLRETLEKSLANGASSVFPFRGRRCMRITERVMVILARSPR